MPEIKFCVGMLITSIIIFAGTYLLVKLNIIKTSKVLTTSGAIVLLSIGTLIYVSIRASL